MTGSGAILALGNGAFEIRIVERVILDGDRQPLFAGHKARPARHRPALQRAVDLEAEVVVQPSRVVFLDDEAMTALRPPCARAAPASATKFRLAR